MNTFDDKLYDVVQRVEQIKESIDGENGIQSKIEKIDELDTAINGEEGLVAKVEELKAFQESIESGIIGVNTGSTVSEITQTSNGYDGGAKALLLCPITDSPSFFNGTIKWSNLFYVNVFCNKNNVEISQVFKLQGD